MSLCVANSAQSASKYRATEPSAVAVVSDGPYPTLTTARFQLRPFMLTDIGPLAALAGQHRIADTTIGVPHPYTTEFARMWISTHVRAWEERRALHWAACKVGSDRIAGYAGLNRIDTKCKQAELRFWVGCGVERNRDAVEWSAAIVQFSMAVLDMNRVNALQLGRHRLAAHVLAAIGMQTEGRTRKRIGRDGQVEDVIWWAILRRDWPAGSARG